uniref:Uncharacterized protein C11orf97 homolog isoform X3 n=1 Tax=Geotrypetes seraphini TaxID=260995 RepID=A0A6P8RAC7_GEOSA|nr:uncharacterized protein C11orf97 homolog isoform X3 [Geotrypetes seraphini]
MGARDKTLSSSLIIELPSCPVPEGRFYLMCYEIYATNFRKHFFYIGPSEKIQNLPEEKFIMQRSERHIKSKPAVALEDIWSIKRNISVGHLKPVMQTKNSLLPQPEYYSRYTGIRAQVGLLKDVNHLQSTTDVAAVKRWPSKPPENKPFSTVVLGEDQEDDFQF